MCDSVVASACCCSGYSTRINTTQIQGSGCTSPNQPTGPSCTEDTALLVR
ncbi:hypothetical protein CBL_05664 [Carabus blaptoides fortunei]